MVGEQVPGPALSVDAHPSKRPSQARIHRLLLPCCLAYQGTLRRFTCDDLLRFNNINMDVLTETVSQLVNASSYLLRIDKPIEKQSTDTSTYP